MEKYNLYLVYQKVNQDYDTFDSFVVSARTAAEAKATYPDKDRYQCHKGSWGRWMPRSSKYKKREFVVDDSSVYAWCSPKDVKACKIGTTELRKVKVICTSFNAG